MEKFRIEAFIPADHPYGQSKRVGVTKAELTPDTLVTRVTQGQSYTQPKNEIVKASDLRPGDSIVALKPAGMFQNPTRTTVALPDLFE